MQPSVWAITDDATRQPSEGEAQAAPAFLAVARGVACFLGALSLLNVLAELRTPGFDANTWWVDLRPFPLPAARGLLSFAGVLLVAFAIRPAMSSVRHWLTFIALIALLTVAMRSTVSFYLLLRRGELLTVCPVPFALHAVLSLLAVLVGLFAPARAGSAPVRDAWIVALTWIVCLTGFPLAQMYCDGKTDFRQKSDAVVVFGCRTFDDGTPSDALHDRVATAAQLYRDGLVKFVILSGGPGDGNIHETAAMRTLAMRLGVPEPAIVIDDAGVNTEATARNTAAACSKLKVERLLAVSHFYHLTRVKLAFRHAGLDVQTVPAAERQPLRGLHRFLGREMAALWVCYLRPLVA